MRANEVAAGSDHHSHHPRRLLGEQRQSHSHSLGWNPKRVRTKSWVIRVHIELTQCIGHVLDHGKTNS